MAAAAAATCWISAGTSLYSHRLSTSTPPPSSHSSSCLFIPKAAYRNQHNKEKKDVGKEKSLWRSNDGRLLTSKDGRSSKNEAGKSTAVKSTGLQRKVAGKGALFESKEQQVETGSTEDSTYLSAVVKVFSTRRAPAYSLPWTKQMQSTSTGSAFMIGDGKLLTNAHCVEDAYQVKVKRRGDDTKYVAKVLAIGMECDIALLSVENKDFWKGAEPLNFGNLPHLQDAVTVVGYPFGGDTISVTKGVVSRIEVMRYAYGSSELLGIQIDAAINPGNSGGPAFNDDGECIGVAFQVYRSGDTENIGYVIPTTVVSHFLEDHKRNGKYSGFPYLGTMLQKLENPALRACLKVPSNEGILVQKVDSTYDVSNVLKEGDVIVSFDGVRVGCEGTVPFRSNERIAFRYLISQKFIGDIVELGIIRAGEFMKVQAVMKPRVHLVPHQIKGGQPSYLIVGGLVFTPLSGALIEEECEDNIGLKLLTKARYSAPKFKGEQIVVISLVIPNEVNIGYEHIGSEQILKLNGRRIKNIHHLAHLVDSYKGKYLVLEFAENFVVVLDREAALSSSASILEDYCIPAERSRDLLEPYLEDLLEPFIDSIGPDEATDLDDYGDSPVSNSEIGYDGLLWA